jgi:hypothetical protein
MRIHSRAFTLLSGAPSQAVNGDVSVRAAGRTFLTTHLFNNTANKDHHTSAKAVLSLRVLKISCIDVVQLAVRKVYYKDCMVESGIHQQPLTAAPMMEIDKIDGTAIETM